MVANLLGFVTAPLVFPIAYLLRNVRIVREKLLWIYYDDEDEFGYDVNWWMVNRSRGFWSAYKWCAIRNPAWNLHTLSTFVGGWSTINKSEKDYVFLKPKGLLQKNGKILEPSFRVTGVLKYVDADGKYMDNKGDYLSLKYSIIGSQLVKFYDIRTRKEYWRYSYANKLIGNIWMEIQVGYTTRATFRFKIKNIKENEIKK